VKEQGKGKMKREEEEDTKIYRTQKGEIHRDGIRKNPQKGENGRIQYKDKGYGRKSEIRWKVSLQRIWSKREKFIMDSQKKPWRKGKGNESEKKGKEEKSKDKIQKGVVGEKRKDIRKRLEKRNEEKP
jgi:hypothetical protein